MKRVAIIGAGISGLVCARSLAGKFDVRLFDKSRGVAGRMATRRIPETGANFDHGAQYFTVRSAQVQPLLEEWIDDHIVAPWRGTVVVVRPGINTERDPTPRFVAMPGMKSLGKHLAESLTVRTQTPIVQALYSDDGWVVTTDKKQTYGPYDWLVCTAPPSQTNAILGSRHPFYAKLDEQQFDPCWATMVHFAKPVPVPYDAAFVHENPLRWICRNNSKPGRPLDEECWVLHANPIWSTENLERTSEEVTTELLEAFAQAIGQPLGEIRYVTSHRWRYSAPATPLEETCLVDATAQLAICGDWCSGARVEGAILSGLGAAEQILAAG
ncbi:FAD-dependent oxidoreductase [Bremerella cremea]|uniref:FAD-dependent oxidoreductase n=1 Tax=Bremerella cremea TaxID=1031537 RepID=A0A368KUT5_9BACT|nr:FAD-dependent oxidoreductase [Bremerella cremea]RCS50650.1 FAD-dependent oxidoreductase [Bremerella cremea]